MRATSSALERFRRGCLDVPGAALPLGGEVDRLGEVVRLRHRLPALPSESREPVLVAVQDRRGDCGARLVATVAAGLPGQPIPVPHVAHKAAAPRATNPKLLTDRATGDPVTGERPYRPSTPHGGRDAPPGIGPLGSWAANKNLRPELRKAIAAAAED